MADQAWKNKTLIAGGVLGTLLGIGAAMLYVRAEEERLEQERAAGPQHKSVPPSALLPIAIGVLGVLKQVSGLAERD